MAVDEFASVHIMMAQLTFLFGRSKRFFDHKPIQLLSFSAFSESCDDKTNRVIIPSLKMNKLKNISKRGHVLIGGSIIGDWVSLGLWQYYEPQTISNFAAMGGFCSIFALQCFMNLFLISKLVGKLELDSKACKLTVSHLDLFGTRQNKSLDLCYCHFESLNYSNRLAFLSLPDGKYLVSLRNNNPEELKEMIPNNPSCSINFFKLGPNSLQYVIILSMLLFIPWIFCFLPVSYSDYNQNKKDG